MKLKTLSIKNFRNFEDISITLSNKNVVFGMNDVGKTNFLYDFYSNVKSETKVF